MRLHPVCNCPHHPFGCYGHPHSCKCKAAATPKNLHLPSPAAGSDPDAPAECKANARLIAAAPELLEALQLAEATMSIISPRNDKRRYLGVLEQLRTVIAKATASGGE